MKIANLIVQGLCIAIIILILLTGVRSDAAFASLFLFSTTLTVLQIIADIIYLWRTKIEFIKKSILIYFIILMISLVGIFVFDSIKSITPHTRNIIAEISLILFGLNMAYNYILHWIFYEKQ